MTIDVGSDGVLRVLGRDPSGQETGEIIQEHSLQGLSRFARLHQDPRCFGYLTHTQLGFDYICHVYLATTENTVSFRPFTQLVPCPHVCLCLLSFLALHCSTSSLLPLLASLPLPLECDSPPFIILP